MPSNGTRDEVKFPLLEDLASVDQSSKDQLRDHYQEPQHGYDHDDDDQQLSLVRRVGIESKKIWHIVGPAIFSRIASYSMLVITQAFAGHLGNLELAAISIANNVIVGFDFGLLVINFPRYIFFFNK